MERITIVTGVSRGLGAALFTQLHARGDRVVGVGRRFTGAQRELAAAQPDRVTLRETDLTDMSTMPGAEEMDRWLAGAPAAALIHNAAVVDPIGAVGTLPPGALAAAVTVNLTAPLLLTNSFFAALPEQARADVLFVSSGAAHHIVDGWAAYSCSKRGGEAFFDAVAAQFADDPRVRVASVNPGVMDTGMQATIRESTFRDRDRFVALHADGQLPDPAQVARDMIATHLPPGDGVTNE